MMSEAKPNEWEQVHAMWGWKQLHGALVPSAGQADLYLDRSLWGSPPPDVAGPGPPLKYTLKSIYDVVQKLKGHPYVREETVKPHQKK